MKRLLVALDGSQRAQTVLAARPGWPSSPAAS